MEEQELINFAAHGKLIQEGESLDVLISGSYHALGYTSVRCNITPIKTAWGMANIYPFNPSKISEIVGKCDDGDHIWIRELTGNHTHGYKDQITWKGIAKLFIKGDIDEFDSSDGDLYFSAYVPRTPLAESGIGYINSYDGTISFQNNMERIGLRWKTKWGEAEFIDNYQYKTDKFKIDKALIQIQRSQINIKLKSQGITSFKTLTIELESALDDTLWLMSFLSRKRLVWYAGELMFISKNVGHKKADISRDQWLGYIDPDEQDIRSSNLLISLDFLKSGYFQSVMENYDVSPYKATIKQSIIYLLMSYERGYFEAHLGSIYAAIESLVDGLNNNKNNTGRFILPPEQFKPIIPQIKAIIESDVKDKPTAKLIMKNIEKINRSSKKPQGFVEKLIKELNEHHVNYEVLWQSGVDIEMELREIRSRRDLYIHQGTLGNFNNYYSDLIKLRTLCELWILKLLDYPDNKLNQQALRLLKL